MNDRCNVLIHFGNPEGLHEISADTLIIFIEAYKEIAKQFGVKVELHLTIPELGGWKANLAWGVSFIGVSPFLVLFTGENTDEWAKKGHDQIISAIDNYITIKTEELEAHPPKECIEQKNRIYRQLGKDECVTNFRLGNHPAISKRDFHLYLSEIPDVKPTYVGLTNIAVFSPDWHGERSWRGRVEILSGQERSFDFERKLTHRFWDHVHRDKLKLHTTDVMQVQLIEFPIRKVNHRVIRVLSHNGTLIDTPLSENVISSMCRLSDSEVPQNTQPQSDLFE
jgi:hypothetical protein